MRGWCCRKGYLYCNPLDFLLSGRQLSFKYGDLVLVVVGPGFHVSLEYGKMSVSGDISL